MTQPPSAPPSAALAPQKVRVDVAGVALLAGAAAVWVARDDVGWFLARQFPRLGFPLLSLWVRAAAWVLGAAGAFRLRRLLGALDTRMLHGLDALEERLSKLRHGKLLRAGVIGLTVGFIVLSVFEGAGVGSALETRALDLFFRLRFPERSQAELATGRELPSANRQDDVVVLALDDETIAHLGWPMPRKHWARLIDVAAQARPKSLAFDVSIVDPSAEHPEWDAAIGEAARRAGNVTFAFTVSRITGESRPILSPVALKAFENNTIAWHDQAAGLPDYAELVGGDAAPQPVIEPIAEHAGAIAMANVLLDGGDDVLRHALLVARLRKQLFPSLSLRLAAHALEVPLSEIRVHPGSHVDLGGKRRVPIDRLGRTLVRYQGRHDARGQGPFQYVSLWALLRNDASITLTGNPLGDDQRFIVDDSTRVKKDGVALSLAELDAVHLQPGAKVAGKARYSPDPGRILELEVNSSPAAQAEPDFEMLDETTLRFATTVASSKSNGGGEQVLAGKHVLVGSTALAAADLRSSPLGEMPGVEHHATMLANLLHGDFFVRTPTWLNATAVLGAAVAAAGIGVAFSAGTGLLVTVLLMLSMLTGSFLLSSSGVQSPVVGPTVAIGIAWLSCLVLNARASRNAHAKAEKDREFVRSTFGRYLTEQVVQQLLDSPDGLKLGGQRDFVTIMMTDLRGFTSMCGTMQPEDVVRLLNHYLEAMTRIITKYGGTIDEFIGDAILVVFGAPVRLEHAEARAAACAVEMLNAMPGINQWNQAQLLPQVEMGIGIHSGEVVLGNIGSELRAKYGIVGATINLTSRVESYTVGGQVLISETTRARAADALVLGQSQVVSPKGVKGTLTIHEVLAVKAPFEVKLRGAEETLVPPKTPMALRYATIKEKQVGELTHLAKVEAISELGMELKVEEELAVLSNLQLRVEEGSTLRPGDLYGKVLNASVRPNVVYLRLTSVPPEIKPLLDAARGGAAPPAEVMAPALGSQ